VRRTSGLRWRAAAALALAALARRAAASEPVSAPARDPLRLLLEVEGSCPSEAELGRQLAPLLPEHELVLDALLPADAARPPGARSVTLDAGSLFIDEQPVPLPSSLGSDCTRRAQDLAVVIALVVAPPPEPESPPPPPAPAAPPRARRAPALSVGVEAGPTLTLAPSGPARLRLGATLRYSPGPLGLSLGVATTTAADFVLAPSGEAPGAIATLQSTWLSAGLALATQTGRLTHVGALGPAVELLRAAGGGLDEPSSGLGVEVGVEARYALELALGQRAWVSLPLGIVWCPAPLDLTVGEVGSSEEPVVLGQAPAFSGWVGLGLGLRL
jgi:hypothetical protein